MTEPTRTTGDDPDLIATPRSTLFRAVFGAASAAATALIYELVRTLVIDSVGDDPRVKSAIETIFWLPVVVLALSAAAYVVYRVTRDLRERLTAARTSDLIVDLVQPGPPIESGAHAVVERSAGTHSLGVDEHRRDQAVAVIQALPIADYRTAALLAMLTAMLEAPSRDPNEAKPPKAKAIQLLGVLVSTGVIELTGGDRCRRLSGEERPVDRSTPMWRAALPALVRYHADLAARWAIAVNAVSTAPGAQRWFTAEAEYLERLLSGCARTDFASHMDGLREAVLPDLARIADALDAWYAVRGLGEDYHPAGVDPGPAQAMRTLTQIDTDDGGPGPRSGFGLLWELSGIRTGDSNYGVRDRSSRRGWARLRPRRRPPRYRPRQFRTSLLARGEHRAALARLSRPDLRARDTDEQSPPPERADALRDIEAQLEHAWWRLPRADTAGEVAALVNLAVVHLHQHRLGAATDRLELAESLTRGGLDPRGRAHVHEIMGVVWWVRAEVPRALRFWQAALRDYRMLDDTVGIARCLQHLGSAAVVAPELCGALIDTEREQTTTEVLRQATGWLWCAIKLAEGTREATSGQVVRYAADYRDRAARELSARRRRPLREIVPGPLSETGADTTA